MPWVKTWKKKMQLHSKLLQKLQLQATTTTTTATSVAVVVETDHQTAVEPQGKTNKELGLMAAPFKTL